jgi:hypothetical protein
MNANTLRVNWRRGWSALFAIFLFNTAYWLIGRLANAVLPEIAWVRWAFSIVALVAVGPIVAWAVIQFVFPGAQPLPTLRSAVAGTFSDEGSAYVAVAALGERGIRAVVSTGLVGQLSGLPAPSGNVQVLVPQRQLEAAQLVLSKRRSAVATS